MSEMYEQFRSQVLVGLRDLDADTLNKVARTLDRVGNRYEFVAKENALVPYSGDGLPDCAKSYLVTRKIEGLSASTLRLYKLRLTQFFAMCSKPLQDIRANDIRAFLYQYQELHGVSNRTLDGIRTAICEFFKWLSVEEYIPFNPAANLKKIKYEKQHRAALTQMELEIVRHNCQTAREKAILEFLFSTGCRVSEAATVKLSDIDWERKELTVLGKGNKHRKVFLNAKAIIAIKEYQLSRNDKTDSLFVSARAPHLPMSVRSIEYVIAEVEKRCNLSKPLSPHIIRHTTATLALQSGMDVTKVSMILGHESLDTTMIYAEVSTQETQADHKKYIV